MGVAGFINAFRKKDGAPKTTDKVEKETQVVKKSKEKVDKDVKNNVSQTTKKAVFVPKEEEENIPENSQTTKVDKTICKEIEEKVISNVPVKDKSETSSKVSGIKSKVNKPFVYKPLKKEELTILLIENTTQVANQREDVAKIIQKQVPKGLVTIINYGNTVKQSQIYEIGADEIVFLYEEGIGNNACFYDALKGLHSVFFKDCLTIHEKETERIAFENIKVIGIGTCTDNCSKTSKEDAIDYFYKVATYKLSKENKVTTKYFCLTEKSFIDASEIGFHSIGAICREY